jgi:hypothetical protein
MSDRKDAPLRALAVARSRRGSVARPFARAGMLSATGMMVDLAAPVTSMILLDGIMAIIDGGGRMSRPR